jgi:two-component system, NarL family, invasion response regulator UvrY
MFVLYAINMQAEPSANKIRTILIDDHAIVRAGIALICKSIPNLEIIGDAATGRQGIQLAREYRPDLIILDFKLPDISGIEVTRRLLKISPVTKILIVTGESYALTADWFGAAGAHGSLEKTASPEQFKQAIAAVLDNIPAKKNDTDENLCLRELEILRMMIYGHTIQHIASRLCLDLKTIYVYRSRIFKKFKVKNTVELTFLALRKRWTALENI